jgi:hypothetical protein
MKKKIKNKTGRPRAKIDWRKVDHLLQSQCDGEGIAGILGICADTLYRAVAREKKVTFAAYSQQKKQEGKELLRAKQFEGAMNGDKAMLIWLGKQYLRQKDKNDITTADSPFTIVELPVKEIKDAK